MGTDANDGFLGKIAGDLDAWLDAHGHASVLEVVAAANTRVGGRGPEIPVGDLGACNGCGICETLSVRGAIHVVDGPIALDGERCSRSACVTRCRRDALAWPTTA